MKENKIIEEFVNRHRISSLDRQEIEQLIVGCKNEVLMRKLLYVLRYIDDGEVTILR